MRFIFMKLVDGRERFDTTVWFEEDTLFLRYGYFLVGIGIGSHVFWNGSDGEFAEVRYCYRFVVSQGITDAAEDSVDIFCSLFDRDGFFVAYIANQIIFCHRS